MLRTSRRGESGMSAIPFVIALLVILVLGIAWYNADKEAEDLKKSVATATSGKKEADEKLLAMNAEMQAVANSVGFANPNTGLPDKTLLDNALKAAVDKWREVMTIEFTADKYQAVGGGPNVERIAGDKVRVLYIPNAGGMGNLTVASVLPLFEAAAARMMVDVKRFVEQHAAAVAAKAAAEKAFADTLAQKDTQITASRTEMETGFRTRDEQINELRAQVASKDQAVQAAQAETESIRSESARTVASLTAEGNRKEAELKTIVRRDQPFLSEGIDGHVLAAGAGVVVVDRGRKDMLMPGTIFKVLGVQKGGDQYVKGVIKVTVSHEGTADARVVDQTPGDPIGEGDLIQSETYSPNRKMRFVLVGDFRKMGRTQAEARLRQLGAQVDASVSPETHYIVVGAPAAGENMDENAEVKRARSFNITQLTEDQLAAFTLY